MGEDAHVVISGDAGSYRLLDEVGKGGFGVTFRAERVETGETVAVKQLRFDRIEDWKAVELFEREANVLASLEHPLIPDYVDNFVLDAEGDEPTRFVLVQQFVEGTSLDEIYRLGKALGDDEMSRWFRQILEVCDYLHGLSPPVIHRDVSPGNVVISDSGDAYLIDFGTVQAKVAVEGHLGSTAAGTFGFAAMEQFVGRAVPASDLYGLAMTFLAVRSGLSPEEMPFGGNRVDVAATLRGAAVGARMAELLESMTEPDPRQRPQSAREVLDRLEGALAEAPGSDAPNDELAVAISDGLGRELESRAQMERRWLDAREAVVGMNRDEMWSPPPSIESMEPVEAAQYESTSFSSAISDDGRWMVFADNRGVFTLSLDTMEGERVHVPDRFEVPRVGINADGTTAVVVGTMGDVATVLRRAHWAARFEVSVTSLPFQAGHQPVCVDPEGAFAVIGGTDSDEPVRIVELETGLVDQELGNGYFKQARFSPDGRALVVRSYDVTTVHRDHARSLEFELDTSLAFRNDGWLVASGRGPVIRFGESLDALEDLPSLYLDAAEVEDLRFSPDGRILVALLEGESGAEFRIFDVARKREVGRVVPPIPGVAAEDVPCFGTGADGGRLFYETSSHPTLLEDGTQPGIWVHSLVRDRHLGVISTVRNEMIEHTPHSMPILLAAEGFHGPPEGIELADRFQMAPWYRPELVAAQFLDVDPATLLEGSDYDRFFEYRTRYRFASDLVQLDLIRPGSGLREVLEAAAGLGYLWPVAYPRAVARGATPKFGGGPVAGASHRALVETFAELRDRSQSERDELLRNVLEHARELSTDDETAHEQTESALVSAEPSSPAARSDGETSQALTNERQPAALEPAVVLLILLLGFVVLASLVLFL